MYKLLRAQDGQKPSVMIKSHEIIAIICEYYSILYVFRLEPSTVVQKTYDVCVNKRVHSSAWFQAGLITSYIQTTESRNSVVEGTAQGNYPRGWGLSVVKGRAQHTYSKQ